MAAALPAVGGAVAGSLVSGLFGQKQADAAASASKKAGKLSDLQAQQLRDLQPFLKDLRTNASGLINPIQQGALDQYRRSQQFDPATEAERAMQSYDQAAQQITKQNLDNNRGNLLQRGFTAGNAPSQGVGTEQQILARAANDRGQYASNLELQKQNRYDEVTGRANDSVARAFGLLDPSGRQIGATNALQGPAQTQLGLAQMYGQQASNANPGALIPILSQSIGGIKWPWQKKSSDWKGIPYANE